MRPSDTSVPPMDIVVGMGQVASGRAPQRMRAIVGSCVAVAIHHPGCRMAAMAHVVLPESAGRNGDSPGKFADTAVPCLLGLLRQRGACLYGLTAKLAGGADMFGGNGPLQIGSANVRAVAKALQDAGVRLLAQEVGGSRGRRVEFDCASGEMLVQCAGEPARTL